MKCEVEAENVAAKGKGENFGNNGEENYKQKPTMRQNILQDLVNLQKSFREKIAVKLDNKGLQKYLIRERFVTLKEHKVKCNKSMAGLIVCEQKVIKAKNILKVATQILPSITGQLVLTTNQGIMSHPQAVSQGIGGKVLAIIF